MLKPNYLFSILVIAFLVFSFSIYTKPLRENNKIENREAALGKLVWQKYNCQSCHQIYGLGGYLGPDLTNLIADKSKDKAYINAMLQSGFKQMPKFNLNKTELENLVAFLKATNKSGIADPKTFDKKWNGFIAKNNE